MRTPAQNGEKMRTYLVTGGAGFIGSNYIHYMFKKYDNEIRIINVDALTYAGNLENLKDVEKRDNYTFVKANICDKEAIGKIFAENDIDRVVHFAAESHVDRSIRNPEDLRTDQRAGYRSDVKLCQGSLGASRRQLQGGQESSCMYLRMRSTDLFPMMTVHSSMRPRLTIPTVLTPQVRQARTCW